MITSSKVTNMTDEQKDVGTGETTGEVDQALLGEARNMGWVPQEEFRGDKANWVDAATFVDKGRHILPILQKNNERLQAELRSRDERIRNLDTALKEGRESIEALEEYNNEETKRRVEQARADLKKELIAAKKDGDFAAE